MCWRNRIEFKDGIHHGKELDDPIGHNHITTATSLRVRARDLRVCNGVSFSNMPAGDSRYSRQLPNSESRINKTVHLSALQFMLVSYRRSVVWRDGRCAEDPCIWRGVRSLSALRLRLPSHFCGASVDVKSDILC